MTDFLLGLAFVIIVFAPVIVTFFRRHDSKDGNL